MGTAVTALLAIAIGLALFRLQGSKRRGSTGTRLAEVVKHLPPPTPVAKQLKQALPDVVFLSSEAAAFREIADSYWPRQHRESIPACFVRPKTVEQLQTAVEILRREFVAEKQETDGQKGLFIVKSGGAAPATGCSTLEGGVVIDLAGFRDITISDDNSLVTVGSGLKWLHVYEALGKKNLMIAGGRTSPVGVGGLSLQGGISFYSPKHGFVCSTIVSYQVVLADGSAVTASESSHPDLWRALKGGSNNFGIVTSFTMPCFPANDIWFGCNYMSGFQAPSLVKAFHEYVRDAASGRPGSFDEHATVPITCFGYTQDFGVHATANYLGYTKKPTDQKWPAHWKGSAFASLWTLWSTAKVQTLISAVKELSDSSPAGNYNVMAVTTVKNDLETLQAVLEAYHQFSAAGKRVKGLLLSMVMQPVLPQWMNQGFPNVLGLEDTNVPLIIVEITAKWNHVEDDGFIRSECRRFVGTVDAVAESRGATHRYRFANYCAEWQNPMHGYGTKSLEFMQGVSRKYDPEGLFQKGCLGGFKLGPQENRPPTAAGGLKVIPPSSQVERRVHQLEEGH
ncbi:FAD-dependent monooxygenase CTB5 [Paramyrothecium foliicola]|nr:FAD-dependent monooxygenase CTB5 [Paramyrothecium foliicola]